MGEIQRDALDPAVRIADALRKLIALGGQAGSTDLREWASRELNGYEGSDPELPAYRRPPAAILINATNPRMRVTGQPISAKAIAAAAIVAAPTRSAPIVFHRERPSTGAAVTVCPAEPSANQGIGEIEAMRDQASAKGGYIHLSFPGSSEVAALMDHEIGEPLQQITAVYWSLSEASLAGVIDRVRTTLVELVAEMQAGTPASTLCENTQTGHGFFVSQQEAKTF